MNFKSKLAVLFFILFIAAVPVARTQEDACFLVGHAHIDAAWLWNKAFTEDSICTGTFKNVLDMMDKYPGMYFTQSSAQYYEWMEEKYPEIFNRISQKIKEGRWEVIGGMWIEPDCNLPCGESFVRQLVYGKRYFLNKFGINVDIGWNPDSFGYNWNLPQIYKKCGIDHFITAKLNWNDMNKFPYNVFWWEAPDGTRILGCQTVASYSEEVFGDKIKEQLDLLKQKNSGLNTLLCLFGKGDNGGGPNEDMLVRSQELIQLKKPPQVLYSTAKQYFNKIKESGRQFPVVNDELYLEFHRGTYTTQARNKRNNKKSECLLMNTEKFSSIAEKYDFQYPAENLSKAWKTALLNQFHDILPGSSIPEVYEDSNKDYNEINTLCNESLYGALRSISSAIDTTGEGVSVVVFNPLSWERSGAAVVNCKALGIEGDIIIVDDSGKEVPSQVVIGTEGTEKSVIFVAEKVPSMGYKVFRANISKLIPAYITDVKTDGVNLENKYFKVKIDPLSGYLSSIYDVVNGKEVLNTTKESGNALHSFNDIPDYWCAWELGEVVKQNKYSIIGGKCTVEVIENGPVRARVKITRKSGKSTIEQNIVLYSGMNEVDFNMSIAWTGKDKLLKVSFPLSITSNSTTYEIPYGHILRKNSDAPDASPADKAKWEASAQQWIDCADMKGEYGISLINDSKYGFDVRNGMMRMTVLKSSEYPDPSIVGAGIVKYAALPLKYTDICKHELAYAIYPHAGDWKNAGTVRKAYEFNYPLLAQVESAHPGKLSRSMSFVKVNPQNVILAVMKKAEDSSDTILRLYETAGNDSEAEIIFSNKVAGCFETDMLEKEIKNIPVNGNSLKVPMGHCEIKTLKVAR